MDGVVHGHTQHHGQQRGGHHVERHTHPSHIATHEDGRHHVGDKSNQSHADALEGNHQDDADDEDGDDEREHLATHQILHHGDVLRDVSYRRNLRPREQFLGILLDARHLTLHLRRVEVGYLNHQSKAAVVIVHPILGLRTASIFVEKNFLRHLLFRIRHTIVGCVAIVERLVQVLQNVENRGGTLGQVVRTHLLLQLIQSAQILRLLGLIVVRQFHDEVVGIE